MRKTLLALSLAAILAGCSDDDDDRPAPVPVGGGGGGDPIAEYIEISGAALSTAGGIAQFQTQSSFQVVMNFLISPAAAAITGLSPVAGAEVELIRVDNDGEQVGEVIDSTTTNDDGEYTLELPDDQELGGDLIVVVHGQGGNKLRAQVVSEQVDVTPVSEYVLQKFIASDSNLADIQPSALTELKTQIEAIDFDAGTDLTELLVRLEAEVGDLVDEAVETVVATPGTATDFAGDYRVAAFQWGFMTGPQNYSGGNSFMIDTWTTDIGVASAASGKVNFTVGGEETGYLDFTQHGIWAELESEIVDETYTFDLTSNGTVSFIEEADTDEYNGYTEVTPATVYKFRKVRDRDLFVMESNKTRFYYDPATQEDEVVGQEVFRGVEIMLKKPTDGSVEDLSGDFGRIYVGLYLEGNGYQRLETEANILSFNGTGSLVSSEAPRYTIQRHADGTTEYLAETTEQEADQFTMGADGQLNFGGEESENVFLNSTFDTLVGNEFILGDDENTTDNNYQTGEHNVTLAVKLPEQMLTLDGRVYRLLLIEHEPEGSYGLNQVRFSSLLTMSGETSATIDGTFNDVDIDTVEISSEPVEDLTAEVALSANGQLTLTIPDGSANLVLSGFLNESGSFGILHSLLIPEGEETAEAIGLGVLLEVQQ